MEGVIFWGVALININICAVVVFVCVDGGEAKEVVWFSWSWFSLPVSAEVVERVPVCWYAFSGNHFKTGLKENSEKKIEKMGE